MEVFFYGLFMDMDLLRDKGVDPANPRKGYLNDYTLILGERASLTSAEGKRAYGIVMSVADAAIRHLYSEASVTDYLPEEVVVRTEAREEIQAICYNLPIQLLTGTNPAYARSLYDLARRKGLPEAYVERIKGLI